MSTISRRAFLKTVGVGALSVAAMSVLAGCDVKNPTTTTAETLTGKAGVTYRVSDVVTVVTNNTANSTLDIGVGTSGSLWADVYKAAYVAKAKALGVTDTNKATALTTEVKAEAKKAAEKAVADMSNEKVVAKFTVHNYSEDAIVIADSTSASNVAGCVFTATCNGAAAKCTVNNIFAGANADTKVDCTIELPVNCKEFQVTVTAPKATNVVKYTFVNTNWFDTTKLDTSTYSYA